MQKIDVYSINLSSLFKINLLGSLPIFFFMTILLALIALAGGDMTVNNEKVYGLSGFLRLYAIFLVVFIVGLPIGSLVTALSSRIGFWFLSKCKKRITVFYDN